MVGRLLCFLIVGIQASGISIPLSLLKHSPSWERGVYVPIIAELRRFLKRDYLVVVQIAQLGERQTEDMKVPGSNPESSHEL